MAVALALGACGSGGAHSKATGPTAAVRLRNFAIDAPATVPAGDVTLRIFSAGPTMHELNVARTTLARDALPVAANGLVDEEASPTTFQHLDELEGLDIGDRGTLRVHLTAGHYVLYCNMDGHYQAGMSTEFTVR